MWSPLTANTCESPAAEKYDLRSCGNSCRSPNNKALNKRVLFLDKLQDWSWSERCFVDPKWPFEDSILVFLRYISIVSRSNIDFSICLYASWTRRNRKHKDWCWAVLLSVEIQTRWCRHIRAVGLEYLFKIESYFSLYFTIDPFVSDRAVIVTGQ